jgi:CRISPR/Cas system CSM-associated protein Csm3 (group 7 of RAMP superfamily)
MNNRMITGRLVTRTALHVGAGYGDATTDAFVRQDGEGRILIPGTAIAGALRTLATRLSPRLGYGICEALKAEQDRKPTGQPCGCVVCQLFGDVNPGDERERRHTPRAGEAQATAARLWIYDALPENTPSTWVRDGVGIERASRTAHRAERLKFDLETVPAGTGFTLRLELQCPDEGMDEKAVSAEEQLLAAVLAEWVAGRGVIGGRSSRGLGAFELEQVTHRALDLSDKETLFAYLSEDDPWSQAKPDNNWLNRCIRGMKIEQLGAGDDVARCWVRVEADLVAEGPFLTASPATAVEAGFDHGPLLAGGDRDAPMLSGAGLRGTLRAHAERIARTLATRWATDAEGFFDTCPACSPVEGDANAALASCDALLRAAGVPSEEDIEAERLCLACRLFGSPRRGSRLRVEDALLIGEPQYKPQDFLAIDRFTGGGADRFKFDAVSLWQPQFRARLYLENPAPWELGWLALVLRDLAEGLVPLGFGSAKGFGQVQINNWTAAAGFLTADDFPGDLPEPAPAPSDGVYRVLHCQAERNDNHTAWQTLVSAWVDAFVAELKSFERGDKVPRLRADSYFGTPVETLYKREEQTNGR